MNRDSKILITGGRGMLGHALIAELKKQNYNKLTYPQSDIDLRCPNQTGELFHRAKPDYVFHLAAKVYGIGGNALEPATACVDNTLLNTNVVSAARRYKVKKIVAMGSGCVYPDFQHAPREEEIFDGRPHNSEFAYAHSKRHMLAHLQAEHTQFGLNYAFVVSSNLYGPHDRFDPETGHVIPSLIAKFHKAHKEKTAVNIWGDGSAMRDFMYSGDAAEALIHIMLKAEGPINMGSGQKRKIGYIAGALRGAYPKVDVTWDSTKPNGQIKRVYELGKLNALGFKAKTELVDGLNKTIKWYREQNV